MEWIREIRPCPVCGSEKHKEVGTRGGASHRDGTGEETMVVNCMDCTAIYARPTLLPVGNPYDGEEDYFAVHDYETVRKNAEQMLTEIEGHKGRILELGCGRGISLMVAKERGWDAYGVEMTQQFVDEARANGVNIEMATVEDCKALDSKYNVILMPAILEHLYQPVQVLKKISDALVPGGLLFIDVPNEQSLIYSIGNLYVKPWSMNLSPTFSPYHVVGFSHQSLTKALDLAGLSVKEIKTVKYGNVLPGGSLKRNIERSAMGVIQHVGQLLGRGDGLIAWAEKR